MWHWDVVLITVFPLNWNPNALIFGFENLCYTDSDPIQDIII